MEAAIAAPAPGTFSAFAMALKWPGGNFSKQSQFVSTSLPIRSGLVVTRIWETAPPESLPTIVAPSRSSASRNSAIIATCPGTDVSAPSRIASGAEPIGQSGTMHRCSLANPLAVCDHSRPLAPKPWTKTMGSPVPASE